MTNRKPLSEREKRGDEVLSDKASDKRYRIILTAGSGSGDEYVRELKKAMVNDVQTCCDQYKDQFPSKM